MFFGSHLDHMLVTLIHIYSCFCEFLLLNKFYSYCITSSFNKILFLHASFYYMFLVFLDVVILNVVFRQDGHHDVFLSKHPFLFVRASHVSFANLMGSNEFSFLIEIYPTKQCQILN